MKPMQPITASDEQVRALLVRYACPVPFHEVRTRFLGNIASPAIGVSPIKMVESLWDGKLPEFNTLDDANELIGALIMGAAFDDLGVDTGLIVLGAIALACGLALWPLLGRSRAQLR